MKEPSKPSTVIGERSAEEYFNKRFYAEGWDKHDKKIQRYDFYDMIDFADQYASQLKEGVAGSSNLSDLLAIIHRDGGHYESANGREKAIKDACEVIYEKWQFKEGVVQKEASEWVSVKERLPDSKTRVIMFGRFAERHESEPNTQYTGVYDGVSESWYSCGHIVVNVTHWQPLPPLPNPPKSE